MGSRTPREGLETAFRSYVLELSKTDKQFKAVWEEVKLEGIQDD
jgi:hypothetical protein